MKTIVKQIFLCIFIILTGFFIGYMLRLQGCAKAPEPEIIIDTIEKVVYRDNPVPNGAGVAIPDEKEPIIIYEIDTVYKDRLIVDTIYRTDTVRVYRDYFTKYFYADTILNDSTAFFAVYDTIYQNKLDHRRADTRVYSVTKILPDQKGHIYVGTGVDNLTNIYLYGTYTKKRHLISIGANSQKQILIEYSYRLK